MRAIVAILLWAASVEGANIGMNLPCNKELDGLLAADPDGNRNAFLSCQGVGVGTIGFWERKVCPNDMIFDFINQQCKTPTKKARRPQTLNIAILNNSCAGGETCIGGTVCDLDTLRCLCPYGTIPQMDTLSCIRRETTFINTEPPQQFSFNSFGTFEKAPTTPGFQPNPNFSKFSGNFNFNNMNGNNNNNNDNYNNNFRSNQNGYSSGSTQWKPSSIFTGENNNNNNNNGFQPNPNQKFVFQNFMTSTAVAPVVIPSKKVPILARPGQSCRSNEMCMGGSICTLPIGLCLCPGDLEAKDGECVLPAASSIKITKVGIGALCSDLAECDHGSSCVLGRCGCVAPLVQHEGKCALRQERQLVGPGELCDNGEVCTNGSVCDDVIPVCICPSATTDLVDGHCRPKQTSPYTTKQTQRPMNYAPPTAPPQPMTTQAPPRYVPPTYETSAPTARTAAPTYSNYQNGQQQNQNHVYQATSAPVTNAPPTYNYKTFTNAPPMKQTYKPNHLKISLGGSKQAGVGVRCSLNTDCMIGAYCNGNTNPPSCQCLSTHVNVEGRCEKVVYPGQIGCRSDIQCSAAYTGTSCIDRICVCPEGNKAVDQTCVPANEPVTSPPGGSCTEARECTGGSVCREGWCICPDPSMIVQKGICIQSGPRPTLPPKSVPTYTTQSYQTAPPPPVYQTASMPAYRTQQPKTFNALPTPVQHGRKVAPGGQCGPLDTCVGASLCVDSLCVCPAGMSPSPNGRCEFATTSAAGVATVTHSTPRTVATVSYAHPGEDCSNGQTCTGGSECNDNWQCSCPESRPVAHNGNCLPQMTTQTPKTAAPGESCDQDTICTHDSTCHSGQCRCAPQFVAVSGSCVAVPMATTPQMKTVRFARPLESCDDGERCDGGSSCDEDTGICMCPRGQIVFGVQCQAPPPPRVQTTKTIEQTTRNPLVQTSATDRPTTECMDDSNCGDGKTCVGGRCRCKAGTVDNAGVCESLEAMEIGERPVPISYARHRVLSSEPQHPAEPEEEVEPATRAPSRQETQKPRVVGPPIRRPKPKSKGGSSGGSSSGGAKGPGSYKSGGSGNGNCPPGNDATRDGSGNLLMCNGLEPNCPPRSYCYITSGGFATEEYNCCKSW